MTNQPRVLCTLCARGGSKGIPDKNIKDLGGKPLIAHSIEDAASWTRSTRVVVSTDSEKIAKVAKKHGGDVPFMRPARLAKDDSPKLPAIKHAVSTVENDVDYRYDYVVDLGVAAPLRTVEDIEACFGKVINTDANNAFSVAKARKSPYFNMVELDDGGYARLSKEPNRSVVRRQDTPSVYEMNSSVYVYERDFLMETDSVHSNRTKVSVMPSERSVDIDQPIDLALARLILERGGDF